MHESDSTTTSRRSYDSESGDAENARSLLRPEKSWQRTANDKQKHQLSIAILISILCISNIILLIIVCATTIRQSHVFSPNEAVKLTSMASPLLDSINLNLQRRTAHGTLHDDGSIFRKPPSKVVDEAWDLLSFEGIEFINVTRADIIASGKDPSTRVQWDRSVDAYPAQLEFAHKIHCLDTLRREIWGDHYFGNISISADDAAIARGDYDPDTDEDLLEAGKPDRFTLKGKRRAHRQHTMHCLHILVQDLMCNMDVGIITHNWIRSPQKPSLAIPLADFSTVAQCRDFDGVAAWVREHSVPDSDERWLKLRELAKDVNTLDTDDSYLPLVHTL